MRYTPFLRVVMMSGTALAIIPSHAWSQSAAAPSNAAVAEVVVTASKTGEALKSISGSITALTGADLTRLGAASAADYLPFTPGVVFNQQKPGFSTISIRGVNTSTTYTNLSQSTTGSYIDEIPLTDPFFSSGTPDIDTFDVKDVEVYRGPQGTLFGSASLGGAVNYVANLPNLDAVQAAGQVTGGATQHAGGGNSAVDLMVNAPIIPGTFAVRAVGVYRNESGYIDNVGTGRSGVGDTQTTGGRFLAEWRPASGTTISSITLYQLTRTDDAAYQDPAFGNLTKDTNVPEPSHTSVLIQSLRLDQDLGFATLTGIASYHDKHGYAQGDIKRFSKFGFVSPSITDAEHAEGQTYEVRLASARGHPFQWLIGGMYDRTAEHIEEDEFAPNAGAVANALIGPGSAATLTVGNRWGLTTQSYVGKEAALFGEASYTAFGRLKLTLGGRLYDIRSYYEDFGSGLLYAAFVNGAAVNAPAPASQSASGFSPKLSLSYDLTHDAKVYVLASKGFRFGGVNINPDPSLPRTYGSDSLWNYEIGLKSDFFDHRLSLDASAFKIDWTSIQLSVTTAKGTTGIVNAGNAGIEGVELASHWRLTRGLQWTSNLTYLDAKLDTVDQSAGLTFPIVPGSRLPGASRWMTSQILRYDWDGAYAPFVSASYRYASSAPALLQHYKLQNPEIGNYSLFDLRAGFTFRDAVVTVFVDNLTDRRAVLSATYTGNLGNTVNNYIVRPRTFGVSLNYAY